MIGKFESNKDLIQELTASGARHVGNIANIITGTVAEVTREIGDWVTDAIEMREAAAAAAADAAAQREADAVAAESDDEPEAVVPQDVPVSDAVDEQTAEFIDAEVVVEPRQY
ncbi:hypothetical protein HLB23_27835 [Nocardia uniformis]|uniref:Uncharacterized protein n=1 Tax=Nocardia uniformis TaxID=53432 RepID=A0A849C793_9NOCA|nr:hypothetical protein [Nocardia uniformis]NNH73618.1 hypothetical protein [Nocardia uniformis]